MRKPGEPLLSGAFMSVSCTVPEKARWEELIDERGFGSMSAMVRAALRFIDASGIRAEDLSVSQQEGYECNGCGKVRADLPDHWSEVTVLNTDGAEHSYLHHCLECRSQPAVPRG